jgi:hypothetical protein
MLLVVSHRPPRADVWLLLSAHVGESSCSLTGLQPSSTCQTVTKQ